MRLLGVAYTSEQPAYNQYLALSGSRIQKAASWGVDWERSRNVIYFLLMKFVRNSIQATAFKACSTPKQQVTVARSGCTARNAICRHFSPVKVLPLFEPNLDGHRPISTYSLTQL